MITFKMNGIHCNKEKKIVESADRWMNKEHFFWIKAPILIFYPNLFFLIPFFSSINWKFISFTLTCLSFTLYAFIAHKMCESEPKKQIVNFAFVIKQSIYLLITMATASFSTLSPNTNAYKLTSTCKELNIASMVSGS